MIYDDNHITIDGSTDLAFTEDVCKRYEAYGWHVQRVADGNDVEAIDAAITAAKAETGQAVLHRRAHAHRLRLAQQAGQGRRARRPARRRRGQADQGSLRLAARPRVLRARRRARGLPRRRQEGRRGARRVDAPVRGVARGRRRPRPVVGRRLVPHPARGLGRRPPRLHHRGQDRDPRRLRQGHQRRGAAHADAHGRLGRPGAVQQHADQGRARPAGGHPRRAQRALGRARARHGRHGQRPVHARRHPPLRGHVLRVRRLHAPGHAPLRAHGPAGDLRAHARQHRRRRGRSHAPADRAPGHAARHAGLRRPASGRRQRDGRGLEDRPADHRRAGRPHAHASEPPDHRP